MKEELLSIGEAAKMLNVSVDTLRRWDINGKLKSIRKAEGGNRYYLRQDIETFRNNLSDLAKEWVMSYPKNPADDYYCSNSAVFQSRLIRLQGRLEVIDDDELKNIFPLVVAVAGEIGNNSFDHNLGNWPDIPGVFFGYDLDERKIVLADRGQGILKTLSRARPDLKNDGEALKMAFTEVVSGRAPEERGNGLKFVKKVIEKNSMHITFQTGDAILDLGQGDSAVVIKKSVPSFRGCLATITF